MSVTAPSAGAILKRGRRQYKTIEFPGIPETKIAMRILTEKQIEESRIEAWGFVKRNFELDPEALRGSLHYDRELSSQMLFRALLVADGVEDLQTPFYNDANDLKENLTADERRFLSRALADFTSEADPNLDTEEGLAVATALVEEAKKKGLSRVGLEMLLSSMPPDTLRRSFSIMVSQYHALRTARSSPSSSKD